MYGFTIVCVHCAFMNLLLGFFVLLKEFSLFTAEPLCDEREEKNVKTEKTIKVMRKKETELLLNCIKILISELLRLPDNGNNIIFKVCVS